MPDQPHFPRFRVAAVHAAPVMLDADATLEKTSSLVAEAAANGAALVVFPESWLPGFPIWNMLLRPVDQHAYFRSMYEQSIEVPGDAVARLGSMAAKHGVHISIGVSERSRVSMGAIYNSNLLFSDSGELVHHHRKLVPTWAEKLTWAPGDGSAVHPVSTSLGRLGVLICGENTNPLARYALLAQGEQVHISTYPPVWPFSRPDSDDAYDLTKAIEIRAAAHAFEGKVFNIAASAHLDESAISCIGRADPESADWLRGMPASASIIMTPTGAVGAGPISGEEGILYGDVDVAASIIPKQAHDVIGYYQRFDVFQLTVNQGRQEAVRIVGSAPGGGDSDNRHHPHAFEGAPDGRAGYETHPRETPSPRSSE